jgi:predicted RNase H-like HicB family nuclease
MNYPVVLHKDRNSDYGVTVPDLPGCFSAGKTVDEALAMAKEAIELHLEGLIHEGQPVPRSGSIEQHQQNADYRGGTWALVAIDPAGLRASAKRINITVPQRVLEAIDRAAAAHGQTRSGFLVEAANEYMGRSAKNAHGPKNKSDQRIPAARSSKGS